MFRGKIFEGATSKGKYPIPIKFSHRAATVIHSIVDLRSDPTLTTVRIPATWTDFIFMSFYLFVLSRTSVMLL